MARDGASTAFGFVSIWLDPTAASRLRSEDCAGAAIVRFFGAHGLGPACVTVAEYLFQARYGLHRDLGVSFASNPLDPYASNPLDPYAGAGVGDDGALFPPFWERRWPRSRGREAGPPGPVRLAGGSALTMSWLVVLASAAARDFQAWRCRPSRWWRLPVPAFSRARPL
jgi:hypothetical protein